jgi:hypothetical protein
MKVSTKKKIYITFGIVTIGIIAILTSVVIALASKVATITTNMSVTYVSKEVSGTVKADYMVGGITTPMATSSGAQSISFTGEENDNYDETLAPTGSIALSKQSNNVVFRYSFTNKGSAKYWAIVSYVDSGETDKNYIATYSTDGVDYYSINTGIEIESCPDEKDETETTYYYIKIQIERLANDTIFTGNFKWLLTTTKPDNVDKQQDLKSAIIMNNAIASYDSESGVNNLTDALYALSVAGVTTFETKVEGNKFLYDSTNKKVLYVNSEYNVLNLEGYSSEDYEEWLDLTYSETEMTNNSSSYEELFG